MATKRIEKTLYEITFLFVNAQDRDTAMESITQRAEMTWQDATFSQRVSEIRSDRFTNKVIVKQSTIVPVKPIKL